MKLELTSEQPRLRALHAQVIETDGAVLIKRGRAVVKVGGEGAGEVVRRVLAMAAEGARTEEISELFAAPDRPAVEQLVRELEMRRILVLDDGSARPSTEAESSLDVFYWHFDQRTKQVAERLNRQYIAIMGVNCISRQLATSLTAAGWENVEVVDYPFLCNLRLFDDDGRLAPEQWPLSLKPPTEYREWSGRLDPEALDCLVATSDFGGQHLLRQWNEFCVKRNKHLLPVVLQDLVGFVGPLVVPGETACLECLRGRQNSHSEDPESHRAVEALAFEGQAVTGFHPAMASILGDIAAVELTKFYGGLTPPRMAGRLIEVNLLATQMEERKVFKLPRCPICGPRNRRSPVALNKNVFMPVQQADE